MKFETTRMHILSEVSSPVVVVVRFSSILESLSTMATARKISLKK